MITAHLTETEIQLYVADPESINNEFKAHIQYCSRCQAKAANYALLFKSIHDTPKPAFDFDLSTLVMEQLPAPKAAFPWAVILISLFSALVVTVSAAFFWASIMAVIKSVSIILLAATITGAIVILIFQTVEMLKVYHKQMNTLLAPTTLQL